MEDPLAVPRPSVHLSPSVVCTGESIVCRCLRDKKQASLTWAQMKVLVAFVWMLQLSPASAANQGDRLGAQSETGRAAHLPSETRSNLPSLLTRGDTGSAVTLELREIPRSGVSRTGLTLVSQETQSTSLEQESTQEALVLLGEDSNVGRSSSSNNLAVPRAPTEPSVLQAPAGSEGESSLSPSNLGGHRPSTVVPPVERADGLFHSPSAAPGVHSTRAFHSLTGGATTIPESLLQPQTQSTPGSVDQLPGSAAALYAPPRVQSGCDCIPCSECRSVRHGSTTTTQDPPTQSDPAPSAEGDPPAYETVLLDMLDAQQLPPRVALRHLYDGDSSEGQQPAAVQTRPIKTRTLLMAGFLLMIPSLILGILAGKILYCGE